MARALKWFLLLSFISLVSGFVLIALALVIGPGVPQKSVLHLRFAGRLRETAEPDLFSMLKTDKPVSLATVTDSVRRAAHDDRVVGLILDVRAPEVGMTDVQAIAQAMETFRAAGKWNVGFLETAGEFDRGDAAYGLATAADTVVLSPPGDVNLVGLRAEVPFLKGTLERLRLQVHVDKRYEFKNAPNSLTESKMTAPHREALRALVDDIQEDLTLHLATRRKVPVETVAEWYAAGPFTADEAAKKGLVDQLGYFDSVLAEAEKVAGREQPLIELGAYAASGQLHHRGPEVALIYADGEIMRGESGGGDSPTAGSDTLTQAFRDARQAEVKGVLFRINSPGGSYVASDLVRREIEVTRAAGVPVVVSMGSLAASGGYFMAIGADRIFAESATITGSIGVFAVSLGARAFFEHWLGVTFDSYDATPNADFFSQLDPPAAARKARMGTFLDRIYEDFVTKTAAGRNLAHDAVDKVAHGRVWSGRAAKRLGLVDEVGDSEAALTALKGLIGVGADAEVSLQVFPKPKSPLALLSEILDESARVLAWSKSGARLASEVGAGPMLRMPWIFDVH
ncbi:MAG: S49 family peptidase [Deltaproteobacteria bacterium]|nr:S49 family peptidase [Deltaproteobacteria bacterium]